MIDSLLCFPYRIMRRDLSVALMYACMFFQYSVPVLLGVCFQESVLPKIRNILMWSEMDLLQLFYMDS